MLKTAGSKALAVVAALGVLGFLGAFLTAPAEAARPKKRPVKLEEQLAFGIDMAKRGLWSEALFRFKRAAELSPNNSRILNNMAVSYEAVGQFDTAMEHYKKALKVDPGNGELKKNYARFVEFYQGFRPPEETKEVTPAAESVPDDGTASDDGESEMADPDGDPAT